MVRGGNGEGKVARICVRLYTARHGTTYRASERKDEKGSGRVGEVSGWGFLGKARRRIVHCVAISPIV